MAIRAKHPGKDEANFPGRRRVRRARRPARSGVPGTKDNLLGFLRSGAVRRSRQKGRLTQVPAPAMLDISPNVGPFLSCGAAAPPIRTIAALDGPPLFAINVDAWGFNPSHFFKRLQLHTKGNSSGSWNRLLFHHLKKKDFKKPPPEVPSPPGQHPDADRGGVCPVGRF